MWWFWRVGIEYKNEIANQRKLFTKYPDYVKDENLTFKLTVFSQDIHTNELACKQVIKTIAEKCNSDKYQPEIIEYSEELAINC